MLKKDTEITQLYDLTHTMAADYLRQFTYPWEALEGISDFLVKLGETLDPAEYRQVGENIWVHRTAEVFSSAYLHGPVIVGPGAQIRQCAFIRQSALIGEGAVVGNSTELKNVILFNKVEVPHYNYVGDSILGYYSHMGAGSITSNVKSDKTLVVVKEPGAPHETGRKKFGAILGDNVEVGCNSVLNPGTVIGRRSNVYPTSSVRGVIPADSIYKDRDHVVTKEK